MKNTLLESIANINRFKKHPLGFYYLNSQSLADTRVHVWLSLFRNETIQNDRHLHSYDINSLILLGRMKNTLFSFIPRCAGEIQEFEVHYDQSKSRLVPTGRSGELIRISEFESLPDCSYWLDAGTIHRVSILERPCVTVVRMTERNIQGNYSPPWPSC
jgi:hypothetical protein